MDILAAAQTTTPAQEQSIVDKILSFEMPSHIECIDYLEGVNAVWGFVLVVFGMVYLLKGWKTFKFLVVANALVLGVVLGGELGGLLKGENMPLFGSIAGGVLLAALAWPLMKAAVSVMGAMAGGLLGYGLWGQLADTAGRPALAEHAWAGGLLGLITLGLLAFVIFRLTIMIFTSFQGSMMIAAGFICLLLKYDPITEDLRANLVNNSELLSLLIVVLGLIGFAVQYTAVAKKEKKKKKAAEGD